MTRPVAEAIAEVVADIRAGRVNRNRSARVTMSLAMLKRAQLPQPVVDCTAIHKMQLDVEAIDPYDDFPQVTPPWPDAMLCYVNEHGNVVVIQTHAKSFGGTPPPPDDWYTENDVNWSCVRWIIEATVWAGGVDGTGRPAATTGPLHMFRYAVNEDGSSADINWISLTYKREQINQTVTAEILSRWTAAMVTTSASLNFLNASNVGVAEPDRPRPERRRIARTGVTVQTIVVRPPGKRRTASTGVRPLAADESVLRPRRGHWAHYGPRYDRGLLFGRYPGKFWIPAVVPDNAAPRDYVLKPKRR